MGTTSGFPGVCPGNTALESTLSLFSGPTWAFTENCLPIITDFASGQLEDSIDFQLGEHRQKPPRPVPAGRRLRRQAQVHRVQQVGVPGVPPHPLRRLPVPLLADLQALDQAREALSPRPGPAPAAA